MKKNRKLSGGIYLVVDPCMNEKELHQKLTAALQSNEVAAVQVWDNFLPSEDIEDQISRICDLCHEKDVPVFINNKWQFLNTTAADGLHLDELPEDLEDIRSSVDRHFMTGVTCNNDLAVVKWADTNNLDYVSFCSIFTSTTSNSCELVDFETIRKARNISDIPIFLSGGIRPGNIQDLKELDFDGIAVVSGIMSSVDPENAINEYLTQIKNMNK